jgi:YHS domain-containing protein
MNNKLIVFAAALLALELIAGCARVPERSANSNTNQAQTDASAKPPVIYAEDGIAIKGIDPVAYFNQGSPVPGSSEFEYEWEGVTWRFANAENRNLFINEPDQYAPQYGGYCAWAVAQGNLAPIDPNAWSIVDHKLYLNFNKEIQQRWQQDIPGNIAKANANWPEILNK